MPRMRDPGALGGAAGATGSGGEEARCAHATAARTFRATPRVRPRSASLSRRRRVNPTRASARHGETPRP